MKPPRWQANWSWDYWRLAWRRPWGATGWTPTLWTWQLGPLRVTRFADSPMPLDAARPRRRGGGL